MVAVGSGGGGFVSVPDDGLPAFAQISHAIGREGAVLPVGRPSANGDSVALIESPLDFFKQLLTGLIGGQLSAVGAGILDFFKIVQAEAESPVHIAFGHIPGTALIAVRNGAAPSV